jgi:hypothetical protein
VNGRLVMVRVFARCASDTAAATLQAQLLQALSAWQAQPRGKPERYWKMPELFELTFTVAGTQHFAAITGLCKRGWTAWGDEQDPSWVWNAEPGACFLHPDVTWAEVLPAD